VTSPILDANTGSNSYTVAGLSIKTLQRQGLASPYTCRPPSPPPPHRLRLRARATFLGAPTPAHAATHSISCIPRLPDATSLHTPASSWLSYLTSLPLASLACIPTCCLPPAYMFYHCHTHLLLSSTDCHTSASLLSISLPIPSQCWLWAHTCLCCMRAHLLVGWVGRSDGDRELEGAGRSRAECHPTFVTHVDGGGLSAYPACSALQSMSFDKNGLNYGGISAIPMDIF